MRWVKFTREKPPGSNKIALNIKKIGCWKIENVHYEPITNKIIQNKKRDLKTYEWLDDKYEDME